MEASVTIQYSLIFKLNDTVKKTWPLTTYTIPVTGNCSDGGTINVTTTPKALPMADVCPGGLCALHNLSKVTAEVIHIRRQAEGSNIITLKPGEAYIVRLGFDSAPKIVSEEGTPLLRYFCVDD
jgi:hypothetical protein